MSKDVENFTLFNDKTLSSLFEDIYKNAESKKRQINTLLKELAPFIKDGDSAQRLVPVIKEYLEIGVKNDDQLIKLAQIAQRIIQAENKSSPSEGAFGLSDYEKEQLMTDVTIDFDTLKQDSEVIAKTIEKIEEKEII